jgi:hypothetical protein
MSRYHTARSKRTRLAERAQIDVQRATIVWKATRVPLPSTWCSVLRRSARIVDLGDHVLVVGTLTDGQRERLSLTHIEQHRHLNGVIWLPKEVPDAA